MFWPTILEESDLFMKCQGWHLQNWTGDERAEFNRKGHCLTPMIAKVKITPVTASVTARSDTASGQKMIYNKIGMAILGSRYAVEHGALEPNCVSYTISCLPEFENNGDKVEGKGNKGKGNKGTAFGQNKGKGGGKRSNCDLLIEELRSCEALPRCDVNEVIGRIDFKRRYTRDELREIVMALKPHIEDIDRAVEDGENDMIFCHRGALRSPIVLGSWIMVKTRCNGSTVYKYMKALRPCIEWKVELF